jgi:hypothetical protein
MNPALVSATGYGRRLSPFASTLMLAAVVTLPHLAAAKGRATEMQQVAIVKGETNVNFAMKPEATTRFPKREFSSNPGAVGSNTSSSIA